jgi:hypothetical protein
MMNKDLFADLVRRRFSSAFFHVCLVEAAIFCSAVFFGSRIENKNCVANSCRFGFRESLGVDSSKTFLESLKVSFPRRILVLLPLYRDREYNIRSANTKYYYSTWSSESEPITIILNGAAKSEARTGGSLTSHNNSWTACIYPLVKCVQPQYR